MREVYSVSQLATYLRELLETDLHLADLWVEGEVSNLSRSTAGHTYFTLKDPASAIRGIIFRSYSRFLKFQPRDGLQDLSRRLVDVVVAPQIARVVVGDLLRVFLREGELPAPDEELKKRVNRLSQRMSFLTLLLPVLLAA